MAKPIGTLGTIETLTVGGRAFTDMTNLICLSCQVQSSGASSTFRKGFGTSGYQVTTGKTLTIGALRGYSDTAATKAKILYCDNDLGDQSATAPTNPVYVVSATWVPFILGSQTTQEIAVAWPVPALKYFSAIWTTTTANIWYMAFGYEA